MSMQPVNPNPVPAGAPPHPGPPPVSKPPATPGSPASTPGTGLPLPHERDESSGNVADAPDPVIEQAKRDLDAGMVDTDMRATPGLDAERRAKLVPGPGGQPPKI